MNIGVVGARTITDKTMVRNVIDRYTQALNIPPGYRIISGGAEGVDTIAIEYAKHATTYLPDMRKPSPQRYYDRNQQIVDDSDVLIAITDKLTGGTWDTIRKAHKKGILVMIHLVNGEKL